MKLITFTRDTNVIFKVMHSEVRSGSDGYRNLVNSIALVALKGFEPKLARIFRTV